MKKIFLSLFVVLGVIWLAACNGPETKKEILVEFEGAESITITTEGVYKLPEITLSDGKTVIGWALSANATTALFKNEIRYSDISDFASNGKLKLYPVIESSIELTMKGVNTAVTVLSNITKNTATLPLVNQTDRQVFVGWSLTENADEAQIAKDEVINFETVSKIANSNKVTLYPVVITYDIMICVHASHSNGNIYVSEEQRAELEAILKEQFSDAKILVDYIDSVSATNFAVQAVQKDYDIVLTSKSARNSTNGESGDIATAAISAGKAIYAEADANETVLTCIDLNQSRQVCRILGSEEAKPYQEQVYTLLTTPVDKVIEITFVNGDKSEVVLAHRVVDGKINAQAYEPSTASGIMESDGRAFDGWTTILGGTEVEFANASYANVSKIAINGKVTLYPVFKKAPDAYILVWGLNGSNEYVSREQYEQMITLFEAYLTANNISTEGKDIQIIYFEGKTNAFQSELTKPYVLAAVGASSLSNDTYAQYWTINREMYAKVENVKCTNASRYCALREDAENNEFAVAFFNALCSADVTVKFTDGEKTSEEYKVNSVAKNIIDLPVEFAPIAGMILAGYALSADGEIVITGNVTYDTVADYAVNGVVTLYPQYQVDSNYDLTIAILRGTATKEYITLEEIEAIKAAFIAYANKNGFENINVEYIINDGATGADFISALPATVDVYVGASNLTSQDGFPGMYDGQSWTKIIKLVANTSRYCGVVATCSDGQLELAKLFVEMLTKPEQSTVDPTLTSVTVAYHATGSKETTKYVTPEMLAKIQQDVAAALTKAGYNVAEYEITWVAYNGNVANASAAITASAADVCIAHTQVFNASKTETPFVCAESAPAVQFSNSTEGDPLYCASNLKVGVSEAAKENAIAMIIYNVIAGYAA